MLVVSNTSPLTNLAAIGQFDLLNHLYSTIHIADGVWAELNAQGKHWPGRNEVAAANWVQRHAVTNQTLIAALNGDLDQGEIEQIHPHLDSLRQTAGFYLGETLYQSALVLAGEVDS